MEFGYPEGIDAFDLSIVLNNVLQNALEASEGCKESEIYLKSVRHENVFIVNVRNHSDNKAEIGEEGIPLSTKKRDGHGYGIKNVRDVAMKYKGEIEIRQENTGNGYDFIINVMMLLR